MAHWQISTKQQKSVEEHQLWKKDNIVIRRVSGYRSGTVIMETETDKPPELDQSTGPRGDAVNVFNCGYECELDNLDDEWYVNTVWPNDMPTEECEKLDKSWEQDCYQGWEQQGWEQQETECWFAGELEIIKIGK